uniref:Merozoite surface antigen 2c1 n=1 Tax=Babesia orientalis TaxID=273649 RepID=A0A7S8BTD2_9APIC|nr:Merozoite surface antigen 2c1 [Babesia orientalis]
MMGAKLAIAALCCLNIHNVLATAATTPRLFDEMKVVYSIMGTVDNALIKNVIDVNYKHVKMESVTAEGTLSALQTLKQMMKGDDTFGALQFGEWHSTDYSEKPIVETFKSLIDSVTSMKKKVEELREEVKPLVSYVEQSQKLYAEFKTYYQENMYNDVSIMDVDKLKKFCDKFLGTESKLVSLADIFEIYDQKRTRSADTSFIAPTDFSPSCLTCDQQGGEHLPELHHSQQTTNNSQSDSTTQIPPEVSTTTPNPQSSLITEKQVQNASSATFTGLSVATLCYIVLSAF